MKRTNTAVWLEKYQRWQINVQKDGVRKSFSSYKPGRTGQREANAKADAWLDDGIETSNKRIDALLDEVHHLAQVDELRMPTIARKRLMWTVIFALLWGIGRYLPSKMRTCRASSTRPSGQRTSKKAKITSFHERA